MIWNHAPDGGKSACCGVRARIGPYGLSNLFHLDPGFHIHTKIFNFFHWL